MATSRSDLRARLEEAAHEGGYPLLFCDGMDEAILGLVEHFGDQGREIRVLYDRARCIKILARDGGCSLEQAEEFFDYNVADAYVGPATPAFFTRPTASSGGA